MALGLTCSGLGATLLPFPPAKEFTELLTLLRGVDDCGGRPVFSFIAGFPLALWSDDTEPAAPFTGASGFADGP